MDPIKEKTPKSTLKNVISFHKNLSIQTKLIYTFLLVALLMGSTGGAGLFFISRIKGTVGTISDLAVPLNNLSNQLAGDMLQAHIDVLSVISIDDPDVIKTTEKSFEQSKTAIDKNIEALSAVIKKGDFNLDISQLTTIKNQFFQQIEEMIASHKTEIAKETLFGTKIAKFYDDRDILNKSLIDFIYTVQNTISQKEDEGRKLSMTSSATAEEVSALLMDLFAQDLPILYRAQDFRTYFIEFQDIINNLIIAKNTETIEKLKTDFDALATKTLGRMKRLNRKLKTDDNIESFNKLTGNFELFKSSALADDGMFVVQTEYIDTIKTIEQIKQHLSKTTRLLNIELEKMLGVSEKITKETQSSAKKEVVSALIYIAAIGLAAIIISIVFAISMAKKITKPILHAVGFAQNISKGNLTQTLDINQSDEIGTLVKALNSMSKNLRNMFQDIASQTQTLTASSTELSAISEQISSSFEETAQSSNKVSDSAEKMTANMNSVAAIAEDTTLNIQMVVSAAEQMSATITEIAGNTAKGSETTAHAVETAKNVSSKVSELGKTAFEISKISETIAGISEQTNLLALNATIEAARAGEAGKGFAVVAGEIKDLALQTEEATREISNKIAGVHTTTSESVAAIESIVEIINEIDQIVASVATAIEEQTATTQEIANNVSQSASGIQEVNNNVNQASAMAGEVTQDISAVSKATEEMNQGSHQVNTSARELSTLAESLNEMIRRFEI